MELVVTMQARPPPRLLVFSSALLFLVGAETMAVTVRALVVRGTVEVRNKGVAAFGRLRQGGIVALGATIRTGPKGRAQLTPLPGVVSAIGPNSEIVVSKAEQSLQADGSIVTQHGMLELRKGKVTTTIDRFHAGVTDFGIRTPRGVAAARGTVYTVAYESQIQSVTVLNGAVTITTATPPPTTFTIQNGYINIDGVFDGQYVNFSSTVADMHQTARQKGLSDAAAAALVNGTRSNLNEALEAVAALAKDQPGTVTAQMLNDVVTALTAAGMPIPPEIAEQVRQTHTVVPPADDTGPSEAPSADGLMDENLEPVRMEEFRLDIIPLSPDGV